VPGDRWYRANRLFADSANPFITLPKRCVFEAVGKRMERTLTWSAIPDYYNAWETESINGEPKPTIGMTEPSSGIYRITLPTFDPEGTEFASYKTLYADLAASRPKLLTARAIILDLRHNLGGSSQWSKEVADALWGQGRVERSINYSFRKVAIAWRTTLSNEQKMRGYADDELKRGDKESATQTSQFADTLMKARLNKETFFIQKIGPEGAGDSSLPAATIDGDPIILNAPVYVIVPGQCASACLDAIDYFKFFPNTILVGAPSSADSTYMEVRDEALPSGYANAIIPMKIWVNRPRGNGEFYKPDIPVNDFDWSTANFLRRIEEDLARRKRS
jgi:Peptidase family S41